MASSRLWLGEYDRSGSCVRKRASAHIFHLLRFIFYRFYRFFSLYQILFHSHIYSDVRIKEGDDDNEPGLPGLPNLHADQKEDVSAKEPEPLTAGPLRELDSRSALHKAVCAGSVDEVSKELEGLQATEALKKVNHQDDAGYFPLHSAAAICLPEVDSFGFHEASEIVRMLLTAGANVAACDGDSNTALHWAARVGNDELTQSLLMNRCPVGKSLSFIMLAYNTIDWTLSLSFPIDHILIENTRFLFLIMQTYQIKRAKLLCIGHCALGLRA